MSRRRRRNAALGASDDTYLEPNGPRPRFSALQRQPIRAGRGRQRSRLPPLERKAAETRVREMHIRNTYGTSRTRRCGERCRRSGDGSSRTPAALDADNSGSINMAELEVAAKAPGFGPKSARASSPTRWRAIRTKRSLSLEEFVRLIAEGAGDAGGLGADAFPWADGGDASDLAPRRAQPGDELQKEEEAGTLLRRLSHKGGERRARPRPVERKARLGLAAGPGGAGVADRAGAAPRDPR